MMQTSPLKSTKLRSSKALGSTMVGIDVGEDLEFVGAAHVVAVAGSAVGDDLAALGLAHELGREGFDHAMLLRHAPYPAIRFDAHRTPVRGLGRKRRDRQPCAPRIAAKCTPKLSGFAPST